MNNLKADIVDRIKLMLLKDDISQIADKSVLDQGVATTNKKLVAITSFYILSYSYNKQTNLF